MSLVRSSRRSGNPSELISDALWLTNIPTPYRVPLWEAIRDHKSLDVLTLEESEQGRNWEFEANSNFTILGCPRIEGVIETPIYLPTKRLEDAIRTSSSTAIVIDGWDSPAYQYALLVAKNAGKGVVASFRSTIDSHRFRRGPIAWLRRWYLSSVDAIVTGGPASTAAVLAMGVPVDRVVTGFNAVDVNRFHTAATEYRKASSASSGHRFLFVGQLIPRKNLEAAIAAFRMMRHKDDEFIVAGSGPKEADIRAAAHHLGLADSVRFLGDIRPANLPTLYASCHTLVLPSTNEVWGLVVNEALAAGLHVVISSMAGVTPSVAKMAGTFPAIPTAQALARQMEASRRHWQGPIVNPEILNYGLEQSARSFVLALNMATDAAQLRNS